MYFCGEGFCAILFVAAPPGGVGTSGSERCYLHEDQTQDALDRPVDENRLMFIDVWLNRKDIARNAHVQSTASSATIQDSSDDNRVRVWRPGGERLNPTFALQRHTAATPSVMVATHATAPRNHFLQDNSRPHTAWMSQDCLRTVTTLPWPARFLDLSPIEHIWDHLGWRVGHVTCLNEPKARLQQIWNEMSQDSIQNLYASMPEHITSCIRARGGSTGYYILPSFTFFSEINDPFSLIF
ncbi:transposable element Tcb1 transposase [Trichonephila clavipes]|uniref:Transposable element Tcb1 transposase n=1 Tax=Trichonephila clavipes TaxID=2585209 RepID=A0A8X6RLC4_TRICX|nr:transposable element Tcb1 transposase [Trichonephila clavipes]